MKVKFNNLYLQNKIFNNDFLNSFKKIIKSSNFIGGKEVLLFEKKFKKICHSKYCVSVANGTDALIISLKCLGISPGDEVILPAHTWVSTAGAIIAVGAKPVFVDTDKFFTIDVNKIEAKINKRTKAIIPVHLYGQPCKIDKIIKLSKKYNLKIVEDCAQAHLTKYKNKIVGNFGDVGTFSFFPAKNIGAMGDAGAIICKNKNLYDRLKKYKNHGSLKKNDNETYGINSRLDTIQACILNKKISQIKKFNLRRIYFSKIYKELLRNNLSIELPINRKNGIHTYHQFVIKVKKDREALIKFLKKKNIETGIHYPKMLINLKPYRVFKVGGDFRNCSKYEKQILSLPMHPFLTYKEIKYVSNAINLFFKK